MQSHPLLDQLAASGVRLGLERITSFLHAMGEPHRAAPVVHVAGTNGKGSTCSFVTCALVDAGYRVGTTVSPHVEEVNERILIDGVPIDDATLGEALEAVDRVRTDWARSAGIDGVPLTYFEYTVAAAFHVFATMRVDVAVVEVGLGGRLDATNVVQPMVCAIPSIGLDHQAELGSTLAEIAGEKAGILKRGVPVVIGPMAQEARQAIAVRAEARGCPVWAPPQLRRERRDATWNLSTPGGTLTRVTLGPQGDHQGANATVALGVLHRMREQGFDIPDDAIRSGFARAGLPGRMEWLTPSLLIDGAHNPAGTQALADHLGRLPRPGTRILLFGMGEGRDAAAVAAPLLPHVDELVTTRCSHPKARDPMELALELSEALDFDISAGSDIEETLPEVLAEADQVVVAGSLFVAGAARSIARSGALVGSDAVD